MAHWKSIFNDCDTINKVFDDDEVDKQNSYRQQTCCTFGQGFSYQTHFLKEFRKFVYSSNLLLYDLWFNFTF